MSSNLSAADVLAWLNCYARQIIIQDLPKSRKRAKNRVILQFAQPEQSELGCRRHRFAVSYFAKSCSVRMAASSSISIPRPAWRYLAVGNWFRVGQVGVAALRRRTDIDHQTSKSLTTAIRRTKLVIVPAK